MLIFRIGRNSMCSLSRYCNSHQNSIFLSSISSPNLSCWNAISTSSNSFYKIPIRSLKVLKTIPEVRQARLDMAVVPSRIHPDHNAFIGFVPTMGALHSGHVDLIERSQKENDSTIVSIFVNPTQFGPNEDYAEYPRTLEKDLQLLTEKGVDFAFVPDVNDLYMTEPKHSTYIDVESIHQTKEHQFRPTHFKGVCTVVLKLLNICQPHRAYFGQKDGVQCIAIRSMIADLNVPIQIVTVPTSRESDGLAKSSRNVHLTPDERKVAPIIYQSLTAAYKLYNEQNVTDVSRLKSAVKAILEGHDEKSSGIKLDVQYISLCNSMNGEELTGRIGDGVNGQYMSAMLSIAVRLGKVRLIDNVILGPTVRTSLDC